MNEKPEEKLLVKGKTKNLYDIGRGLYKLYFKDDMTGENGVFDPGANTVGLTVDGAGKAGLGLSTYYFEKLNQEGIKTHFISADLNAKTMTIRPTQIFGQGLEVICRYKALGSFVRRYGSIVKENATLPALVEMTIKSDASGDPLITKEALEALGVLQIGEYEKIVALTKKICQIIRADLQQKDLELCDIKLEFGKDSRGIVLIDELSAGNMRVRKNGQPISPLDLAQKVLHKGGV